MWERAINFHMEPKPLEGVDVFAWFTHPFIFPASLSPWKRAEREQKGRKTHREAAQDIAQLPPVNAAVAPLTSVFPVSRIALGFQPCNSAEIGLLESPGIFM